MMECVDLIANDDMGNIEETVIFSSYFSIYIMINKNNIITNSMCCVLFVCKYVVVECWRINKIHFCFAAK